MAAREAAMNERSGDYQRPAKVWARANRKSRNARNQDWSGKRRIFV